MRFKTETGSIYEIDPKNKKARREAGTKRAGSRFPDDGVWKTYVDVTEVIVGLRVFFHWNVSNTPLLAESPDGAVPLTITSPVVEILQDLSLN